MTDEVEQTEQKMDHSVLLKPTKQLATVKELGNFVTKNAE